VIQQDQTVIEWLTNHNDCDIFLCLRLLQATDIECKFYKNWDIA